MIPCDCVKMEKIQNPRRTSRILTRAKKMVAYSPSISPRRTRNHFSSRSRISFGSFYLHTFLNTLENKNQTPAINIPKTAQKTDDIIF